MQEPLFARASFPYGANEVWHGNRCVWHKDLPMNIMRGDAASAEEDS